MNRCALCPGDHNCVPADGPEGADYLFLGEGPGFREDEKRKPFCGPTGTELNDHYLKIAGLPRSTVRVDNAMKCMPKGHKGKMDMKRQADRDLAACCAQTHLYPALERNRYKLIIAMGAFACNAIDPSINLEFQHGIPVSTKWGDVFPMYHPSQGLHEPKKMLMIRTDWTRLRKYITGRLRIPTDIYKGREQYEALSGANDVHTVLQGIDFSSPLATDTETTKSRHPFCLTFSARPGTGYLIREDDGAALLTLQEYLDEWTGPLLFHNWLFDGLVVSQMGLRYKYKKIVDTMVRVFQLGNLPQGLKALSYRESGMDMQDFNDLVTPYSNPLVLKYYREALAIEWPKPDPVLERNKDGTFKVKQPQRMNTKIKGFLTRYAKSEALRISTSRDEDEEDDEDDEELTDAFGIWKKWESAHEMVQAEMGSWPGKCITHVPFHKVIHYACRDADATLRLWPIIRHMERQVRRKPQENWIDGYEPELVEECVA